MGIDEKKLKDIEQKLESDVRESLPYLTSDEKSSTLRKAVDLKEEQRITPHIPIQPNKTAPWIHFVAGGLGGMCGAICTSPFDVVKTRLQSSVYQDLYKSKAGILNKNVFSIMRTHIGETFNILHGVYKYEGFTSLFKGLGPNLVGVIPARSINFFTYGYSKDVIRDNFFEGKESSIVHLLSGITAGFVTSTATNPIWLVKTRLQLDRATSKQYKNSFDCVVKILKNEGFLKLYSGLSASYLGSAESTLQWVLYEQMKKIINTRAENFVKSGRERTSLDEVFDWCARSGSAGLAKFCASLITYPHEVVRTRLRQAPSLENGKPKYTGLVQCFKLVIKEEGFASMYGGLTPHLLRTVPNSIIMFGSWELFTNVLSNL